MASIHGSFHHLLREHWAELIREIQQPTATLAVGSDHLTLATLIAVARYGGLVKASETALAAVSASQEIVETSLEKGMILYGINTGFGGSANTRTQEVEALQRELVRGLHYGLVGSKAPVPEHTGLGLVAKLRQGLPLDHPTAARCMPEAWVKATMLVRLNSLLAGASGVKVSTVQNLVHLLDHDIVPQIPLRGSISASGDLSPLSYIGGVMQGKPTLKAWYGSRVKGERRLERSDRALAHAGIEPIHLGAKEGLAIVNGTAVSAAVAALASHEVCMLAILSEILTAMTVEALCGTDESFDPFFAQVRPHPGQQEAAYYIFSFLADSKLVFHNDGSEEASLRQDRYSTRTATQWLGPVLEDLTLAHSQVETEINSITDNPLIDTKTGRVLHGGNFQAKSMTSATEKMRQACQTIGRMLFTQCTELIDPNLNRGLPPNLVIDEPHESFLWKGTDLLVAALQSELGFLANPVGTHVQTAEMANQSLNSLALISARYTLDACDVLTHLAAAHLVAVCQALDLRVLQMRVLDTLHHLFISITKDTIEPHFTASSETFLASLWSAFRRRFHQNNGLDSLARFNAICDDLVPMILRNVAQNEQTLSAVSQWSQKVASAALQTYMDSREHAINNNGDASAFLGSAATRLYRFLRKDLGIPFLRSEDIATPPPENAEVSAASDSSAGPDLPTMGGMIERVYDAARSGQLYDVVMACVNVPLSNGAEHLGSLQPTESADNVPLSNGTSLAV